jgi:hypothetical protein
MLNTVHLVSASLLSRSVTIDSSDREEERIAKCITVDRLLLILLDALGSMGMARRLSNLEWRQPKDAEELLPYAFIALLMTEDSSLHSDTIGTM